MFVRSLLCAAAVLAAMSGHAFAQNLISAPDLRNQALTYITRDRILANWGGQTDPEQILGQVVLCRYDEAARTFRYFREPVPLAESPYYEADPERRQQEASWTIQGTTTVQIGIAGGGFGITSGGERSRLTRLTVRESVRLTLRNDQPYKGTILTSTQVERLALLGTALNAQPGDYWCVVNGASLWDIVTESYNRDSTVGEVGFWIVTSSGKYMRGVEATVPYQVLTHSRVAYSVTYINALAAELAAPNPSAPVVVTPPVVPETGQALTARVLEDISPEALQLGAQLIGPIREQVEQQQLQRDLQIQRESLRELGLSQTEVNRVLSSDVLSPRF